MQSLYYWVRCSIFEILYSSNDLDSSRTSHANRAICITGDGHCPLCNGNFDEPYYPIAQGGNVDMDSCESCYLHWQLYKCVWPCQDLDNMRNEERIRLLEEKVYTCFGSTKEGVPLDNLAKAAMVMFFPPEQYCDESQTYPWEERMFVPKDMCLKNTHLKRIHFLKEAGDVVVISLI